MDLHLGTSMGMRQEMRLAPRMIQSMEILQLPVMALQERIDQELIENPLLEVQEPAAAAEEPGEPAESRVESDQGEADADFEGPDRWDDLDGQMHRPSRAALAELSDRKHDAMQNMAARPVSLQDELLEQLGFLDCDATVRTLAEYIINNLDENGFLPLDLTEVVRDSAESATMEQADEALALVQMLEPRGIGARDLRECLLLQLTPETPLREALEVLISDHLDDIQQNRLPLIEKKTGLSIRTIKEAIEHLRRLDPRPGARFATDERQYVVPDLIVELDEHGEYQVRLADEYTPHLGISQYYQRMLKDRQADAEARQFLQRKIQAARWLIESIEQRRNTILKVAKAIIAHQKSFLDKGPECLEPLKMQQIADQVGVHVTTVSRAVDDKWIQTPRGNFALKRFFGGGTKTAEGDDVAWESIKRKLLEITAKEDKQKPLSDEEIVEMLGKDGIPVARRTVTKYRKALHIPSSRQRREF